MTFIGTKNLTELLDRSDIIIPFNKEQIKNGAYELSLGSQVFRTDSNPRSVQELKENEKIEIKPGQFALLLTKEKVNIPNDKIAFISIKASIKFKGLVNVSGFHVDPGFSGNLLFSVYNAGPSSIVLSNGTPYFPIWFAVLNENQDYIGRHNGQTQIPDEPIEALSQGELASPNVLSKRIDKVKQIKETNEWILRILLGLAVAIGVKLWWDNININNAIRYGYTKKTEEIVADSVYRKIQNKMEELDSKVDSLTYIINQGR